MQRTSHQIHKSWLRLDGLGAADLVPILRSLVAISENLKQFQIGLMEPTIETLNAIIQQLLESTSSSIQTFELVQGHYTTEEMFRPIAVEGLTRSRTVVETSSFETCVFCRGSAGLLWNLIRCPNAICAL